MLKLKKVEPQRELKPLKIPKSKFACFSLSDALFKCICGHPIFGHAMHDVKHEECNFEFYTIFCECKEFNSAGFDFVVEIFDTDIFEFENPNHAGKDSLHYFNELESWRKINENRK